MDQMEIISKEDAKYNKTLTMTGDWEEILSDIACKTPKSVNLLYKTSSANEWQRTSLVIEKGLLQQSFHLPKICLDHSFQLEITGYAGTNPILTDLEVESDHSRNYFPVIQKLEVKILENTLKVDVTLSGCNNAYYFMVTADSSCHQNQNCMKLDSEDNGSGDLNDSENVEDFRSSDTGHISLETGNSAKNIKCFQKILNLQLES